MSSKVKRLKEVKFEILGLGGVKHVFRLHFRRIRRKDPRKFLIDTNRVEFESRKMPKFPKRRKSDFFGPQNGKIQPFTRCQLEVLFTYSSISVFFCISTIF